jgi:hypothetical protein
MRITNLTFLAFNLISALDTGKYKDLSIEDVASQVNAGTIFDFLETRLAGDVDLGMLDAAKQKQLVAEWQDMLGAIDARSKFGVENNGVCLLIAYLLEGIQRRQDNNPRA